MAQYAIEPARASDRAELLELLLTAFRVTNPPHPDFALLYPDLFEESEEAMGHHLVIREEQSLVACVGCYPMNLRIGPCRIRVAGIGQVACAPACRGGGRMTALLDATLARMPETGCELSWLSGRRDRYARFGWELAGSALRAVLCSRSIGAAPVGWDVQSRSLLEGFDGFPLDQIRSLRNAQPLREDLDDARWHTKLGRGQTQVWAARRNGEQDVAAFAVIRTDGATLQEWGGDQAGLHAILAAAVSGCERLSLTFLTGLDPAADLFVTLSESMTGALANLRIDNLAATIAAFAPLLQERLPPNAGAMLAMTREGRATDQVTLGHGGERIELDELRMVRFLFGPVAPSRLLHLPPRLRWLDQVFPLPFLLPANSHV